MMQNRYQQLDRHVVPANFKGQNKLKVQLWFLARDWLFRLSPHVLNGFRVFLLRQFGAKVAPTAIIRPTADIFYPWNVVIGEHSYIGDRVVIYSLDDIVIGNHVSVSMGVTLCAGTHDAGQVEFPLVLAPIHLEDEVWVGAEAFVGPGRIMERGSVLGARSVLVSGTPGEGEIWVGSPARFLKHRRLAE